MKYVREHINEVFTEDSDPIKDMGIGFKKETAKKVLNEVANYFSKTLDINFEWEEGSGGYDLKYEDDIFEVNLVDLSEIDEMYLTTSKKASKELMKFIFGKHKKEIIEKIDLGWIIFYKDCKKVLWFQPYDLENLYKSMLKINYNIKELDEDINYLTKQIEITKKLKALIS